jgi:soluble lytic murein transglycosylase-like protein
MNFDFNNTISTQNTEIEKIEKENEVLYKQLSESNSKLAKYEGVMNTIENININEEDYVYYPIENLTVSQQRYIQDLCRRYNFSFEMILGIMRAESNFKTDAVSYDGSSLGIMQIQDQYSSYYGGLIGIEEYDIFNFEDNVLLGFSNLIHSREYWKEKGYTDEQSLIQLILLSYNRGIGGATKYYRENGTMMSEYVKTVINYKFLLEMNLL